jgi:hypothetical protein
VAGGNNSRDWYTLKLRRKCAGGTRQNQNQDRDNKEASTPASGVEGSAQVRCIVGQSKTAAVTVCSASLSPAALTWVEGGAHGAGKAGEVGGGVSPEQVGRVVGAVVPLCMQGKGPAAPMKAVKLAAVGPMHGCAISELLLAVWACCNC